MRKSRVLSLLSVLVSIALALSGCFMPGFNQSGLSSEDLSATIVAMTVTALQGGAQGDADGAQEESGAPSTSTSTLTLMPSLTATVTQTPVPPVPLVSVSLDTNCRSGPGKIYDWIGALLVGEEAVVVGRSGDGQYWIIENPDQNGECWLWGNYASVTGPAAGLPIYTPPPTPTPVFTWAGNWTTYNGPPAGPYVSYPMTVSVEGSTFTAAVDIGGGGVVNLVGTISEDLLSVYGNWSSPNNSGTFGFFALGKNQFQGNGNDGSVWAWCGGRGSAGQPAPCLKE